MVFTAGLSPEWEIWHTAVVVPLMHHLVHPRAHIAGKSPRGIRSAAAASPGNHAHRSDGLRGAVVPAGDDPSMRSHSRGC